MCKWIKVKISDLGKVVGGATPSTNNDEYYNGDIIWITPKDLSNFNGRYILKGERNITRAGMESCSTQMLPKDSILFSSRAPIGYVAIAAKEMCTNQGFKSVIPNENVDYLFLYYLLKYNKEKIESMGSGTTFKEVSGSTMKNIEVIVPESIEIQRTIAGILDSIDSKIENNIKINDNLQQQAASLYFSMFVSYDYYANMEFEDSEFGRIPKGWQVLSLDDVTINIRDRVHNNNYRVLSALNSGILQPSDEYFTKQVFSKDISNYIIVAKNDFAYNPARVNIGSLGINDLGYTGCVSPVYVVFRTENNYQNFMRFFVKSKRFQEEVKTRASGSVRQSMNYADFSLIRLVYPPKSAIDEFNDMVEPIWKNIKHLRQENEKLSELRDSLLPKLMSGEIDVSAVQL